MKKNLLEQIIFEKKIELAREYMELKEIENLLKEAKDDKKEESKKEKLLRYLKAGGKIGSIAAGLGLGAAAVAKLNQVNANLDDISRESELTRISRDKRDFIERYNR